MNLSIIVTDSSPLITLAIAGELDVLLLPKLRVLVPDMVRFEVIRYPDKPGSKEVLEWLRINSVAQKVFIESTEIFEDFLILQKAKPGHKIKDSGESAAAEVLNNVLQNKDFGAILIFEDSAVKKPNYLRRLPNEVVVVSTSEFLHGLQANNLIESADKILDKAVGLRGDQLRERHINLLEAEEGKVVESWNKRMKP